MVGLLVGGGLGTAPIHASQLTDAFLANAKSNVDFLDKASCLALERSQSRSVKAFALEVAARETIVANTLVAVWQSNTPVGANAALGTRTPEADRDPFAPLGKVAANLACGVTSLVDGSLLTGRSVAINEPAPKPTFATKPLLPSQEADDETLKTARGRRFVAFYELTQRNALRQLVALYRDYASQGDHPALRSLSTLQLTRPTN